MRILWVDDEPITIQQAVERLRDERYDVDVVNDIKTAIDKVSRNQYDAVLVDVMMPNKSNILSGTRDGFETGIALARRLLLLKPGLKIIGCSIYEAQSVVDWFNAFCSGYISKSDLINGKLLRRLKNIIHGKMQIRAFIVHGHDTAMLAELKDFIKDNLKITDVTILREQPSLGKTIIEKFEHYSQDIDVVFVLLTPDDEIAAPGLCDVRRSRQNVIFELGYFFGKLQRTSGKVILICKGELEIPSDISGVVYIHTDNDINSITEEIRNELKGLAK